MEVVFLTIKNMKAKLTESVQTFARLKKKFP